MKTFIQRRFFNKSFNVKDTIFIPSNQKFAKPDITKPLHFGAYHTDFMLEIDYSDEKGWEKPIISPYHNLSLDPRNSALHYAISLFEGMKVYRNGSDLYLFRPELNMKRMNKSAERVSLPNFDGAEFIKCIKQLIKLDESWVFDKKGYSVYLRPTYISISDVLGVSPPNKAKLFVIMSPVGPYFPSGYKALSLICSDDTYIRSFPGGFGERKLAANYGPTLQKYKEALNQGYGQVLWLINDQ